MKRINIFTWALFFMRFMHLGIDDGTGGGDSGGDGGSGGDGAGGDSGAGAVGDGVADDTNAVQAANWLDGVPDDLKGHSSMESIKDLPGLVSSYVNGQAMIGSSIRIPGEDASNEARAEFMSKLMSVPGVVQLPGDEDVEGWKGFYQKLGAPESGDKYEVNRPELPEGHSYDEPLQTAVQEAAAGAGVTQKQLDVVMEAYWGNYANNLEAQANAQKATVDALKTEWGAGFPQRMGLARSVITQMGGEALAKELDDSKLGNNPELAKLLSKIGEQFTEDGIIKVPSQIAETRTELESKINEVMANFDHPYHVKSHPDHNNAVAKMDAWRAQLTQ